MTTKLNIKQAAMTSGMSVAWWRAQVFRRRVPFLKVGRRVLFDLDDIKQFLDGCRVEPGREGVR